MNDPKFFDTEVKLSIVSRLDLFTMNSKESSSQLDHSLDI